MVCPFLRSARQIHNQIEFFAESPNQHHQSNLQYTSFFHAARHHQPQCAKHRHRNRQQNDERRAKSRTCPDSVRYTPAAQSKDQQRLSARSISSKRKARPAEGMPASCSASRALPSPSGPTLELTPGRATHRSHRSEQVVVLITGGPELSAMCAMLSKGPSCPCPTAHSSVQVLLIHAERLICLHKHAIWSVVVVEVVDVLHPRKTDSVFVICDSGNAQRLRLFPGQSSPVPGGSFAES